MKKVVSSKYGWVWLCIALLLVNGLASYFHFRLDLTQEKRYTLSNPTKKLLGNLPEPVDVTIFLSGDMPAGFKKLAGSSEEMLQEFKEIAGGNIRYTFEKPGEGLNDTSRNAFIDSLHQLGLAPMNVKAQTREGEGQEERFIYPGALVSYKGRAMAVDFLQGQSLENGISSLNNAEALLEYKLASAIHRVTEENVPLIGYLSGNGESLTYDVYDLINTIKARYNFRILPIDNVPVIPSVFNAILIVKPTVPFSDGQKLKIDQYIMNGGKVMWMVDNLYAEFDSLQRSQNEFIAFDRGLNIEDQLFRYGTRINLDLVLDLNSDQIPSVIGSAGGKPQIELVPWPYSPLLSNNNGNPISKNLDYVVSQFPNSIDTVQAKGVTKTPLLVSSRASRTLSSPAKVSWKTVQNQEEVNSYVKSYVPVAMLLEGKFTSLFNNRVSTAIRDSLAFYQQPFLPANITDNKMIVISDGDIAMNAVTQKEGPLPMGKNMYTGYQYANKEFMMNCIEYLTDDSGILAARAKDFTLRFLDKKKVEEQKPTWQLLNILLPVILVILFVGIYSIIRKRKYAGL
ncbi:MAG TPA: gliding motility-associated ABC transporter substrate-binding protein GldG [Chitinophagaceae bacterium]|nr:gliding motility-associated ABC transporter substrate-binding protein GldG [Chitinophagaceae bacterium]